MIGNTSSRMAARQHKTEHPALKLEEPKFDDYIESNIYQEPDHEGESPFFFNNPEIHIEDFRNENEKSDGNDHGFDSFLSGSMTPTSKKLDNCLSNDLLKRLEEYSPIKPKKSKNNLNPTDFSLDTWEQNETETTPIKLGKLSSFANPERKKEGYVHSPLSEGNHQKTSKYSQNCQLTNCNENQEELYQRQFSLNQNNQVNNNNYPGHYQGENPLNQMRNFNEEEGFNFPSTIQNNTIITSAKNYIINNIPHNAINQVQSSPIISGQNQVKSFMYGKVGWVCGACKNFNYEIRSKCNRCNRPQSAHNSMTPNSIGSNNQSRGSPVNPNIQNVNNINNINNININNMIQSGRCFGDADFNNNNIYPIQSQLFNSPSTASKNEDLLSTNNNSVLTNNNVSQQMNRSNTFNCIPNVNRFPDAGINPTVFSPDLLLNKANSAEVKKNKKPFMERLGDWVCVKCKNLNFSFRVTCNRCQLKKDDSDKILDQYINNLKAYAKMNEINQFNQINQINMQNFAQEANSNSQQQYNRFYNQNAPGCEGKWEM